ncbi:hypothetical protein UA08_08729 [Talaromyces atroroseus]|uniref:PHD-type domain-containing protein n=1 Tax=Talaromyces atroroseus TaxID=1441469 RepID=A0A225A6A9_TALAT|nr:hypothetical protein UA08_08729 [Talaromyces atroroseus]OKL56041.1 hypothetical protein UA08_08729 [Talaromyces atroroseus]
MMKKLMDSINSFSFSYSNGEPQTPTRTPTSAAFADAAFRTPKFESSFYDPRVTWDTADPYASSPELLKTPQRFIFGGTPSNAMQQQPLDASFGQHLSPNAAVKGPGDTDTAKRRQISKPTDAEDEGPGSVNSVRSAATIQTPPPTRTSRRKALDAGNEGGQGHMGSARRLPEPQLETPSRIIASSPQHLFANFQTSPDFFHFSNINSSASPFFPQQKLFVDQDVPADPFADTPNAFATSTAGAVSHAHALDVPPLPAIQGSLDLPDFSISTDVSFGIGPTAPADAALFPTPFSTSPRVSFTKTEDPSLFLSSPARRFGPPQPFSEPKSAPRPRMRQPYYHQTEEAKREQQRHTSRTSNQSLSGSLSDDNDNDDDGDDDEDFTPRAVSIFRPGLARSKTTTAMSSLIPHSRSQSQQPFANSLSSTSGIKKTPSKGRVSPVKSLRLPRTNSSCLPSRSQSLILKIDKDGRAKTEFQPERGFTGLTDPISEMDIARSITGSEADSTEYSNCLAVQNNLFGFSAMSLTRPNSSRAESQSRPNSKSSFASTVASSASGRRSPWAESKPRRPQSAMIPSEWLSTPRKLSALCNANFTGQSSSTDSTLPDPEEDSGDAQHALRQLLAGRARNTSTINNRRMRIPISQSMHHLQSSPPGLNGAFGLRSSEATSPTTLTDPDLATPSTGRRSNPSNGTRCICKSMDNGGHLMIQCESCNHWLHTKCVGLDRANLPPVYICIYCSSTPMRGGRLRDPLAGVPQAGSSPLARKSFRYR